MKISELFNKYETTLSFEVFPPKETSQFDGVLNAVDVLSSYNPDYMSVTYGAGGSTTGYTVSVADHIQNKLNTNALVHLTCVASSDEYIEKVSEELKQKGLQNILALRGDMPKDFDVNSKRDFEYAYQLIEKLKKSGDFCIGGACYPDGHIECENKETDIINLKNKVDAGCDFLVTQLFFDNDVFYNFLYRLLKANINVPVVAGIMPITNVKQIRRMTKLSGAPLTPKYKAMVDKFENNPEALYQAGINYATEQIIDLISNGVKGIHLYTMNKPETARKILDNLSEIIKR